MQKKCVRCVNPHKLLLKINCEVNIIQQIFSKFIHGTTLPTVYDADDSFSYIIITVVSYFFLIVSTHIIITQSGPKK